MDINDLRMDINKNVVADIVGCCMDILLTLAQNNLKKKTTFIIIVVSLWRTVMLLLMLVKENSTLSMCKDSTTDIYKLKRWPVEVKYRRNQFV